MQDKRFINHHFTIKGLPFWRDPSRTRLFVTIQGMIGGSAGIIHGIYEIMQGNVPTGRSLLGDIGAFTLIQNYLLTGIAAIAVGLALIVWTIGFIYRKNGSTVFLFIAILLTLVGGGLAQIIFYLIAWGVSTQINQTLTWFRNGLSGDTNNWLAKMWLFFFSAGYLFFLTGFSIWLFVTPPGTIYQEHFLAYWICWCALVIGLFFQLLTIFAGFAQDVKRQKYYAPDH